MYMDVPSEGDFAVLPGLAKVDSTPDDGYWCYEFIDRKGALLRFSFDVLQRSVQTVLVLDGVDVCTVSHEGGVSIRIKQSDGSRVITGQFETPTSRATLRISLEPQIVLHWGTLVNEP
jgi:hypothetical protein